jgi:uncharacterized membrane protein
MKNLALTLLLFACVVAPAAAQYTFSVVDFPGAAQTNLFAVNDERQYVGASYDATNNSHAIYFDGSTFTTLDANGVLGTNYSFALSLNLRGDIVGGYADSGGINHGFLYNGGTVTTIDYPGASGTFAYGINDLRQIIGVYADSAGQHAFILRNGVYKNIDLKGGLVTVPFSINDWTEIAGQYSTVHGAIGQGFVRRKDGKFTTYDAPGAPANSTFFISINNFNQILGTWVDASGNYYNFRLTNGKYHDFNLPQSFNATFVSAQTINDIGDIVGYFTDAQNVQHGFLALRSDDHRAKRHP